MTDTTPSEELRSSDHAAARRAYARAGGVLLAAALLLGIFGFLRSRDGSVEAPDESDLLPLPITPEGIFETPPVTFRWTPGGEDVDFSQLNVYRDDLTRIWASGPLTVNEITLSEEIYRGVPAGAPCYWQIREVFRGTPRATSKVAEFQFERDLDGFSPGENPEVSTTIRN